MTADDLVTEFSIRIYKPPLSEVRDSGEIADLTRPLAVIMLAIDFQTEVTMNGMIDGFIGNSTGIYATETVEALRLLGCADMADSLARILAIAHAHGLTYDAIQLDRSGLEPFAVTTFDDTHGSKWQLASQVIARVERDLDFGPLFGALARFVEQHRPVLEPLLAKQ